MYIRYLIACLLVTLLVPASLISAAACANRFTESIEGSVESQEQQEICQGTLSPVNVIVPADYTGDPDDYMGDYGQFDPNTEDAEDIDEDDEDTQD